MEKIQVISARNEVVTRDFHSKFLELYKSINVFDWRSF